MHRGYLALWRKFQDHPFWKERREFSKAEAWIDLLWEVQHDENPQQVVLNMKSLTCNYGESLKSMETWARRWSWSKSRVKRFLDLLCKLNQVELKSETITTRITILNYSQYDPKRNGIKTISKRKRNGSETTSNTDNNVNNVNNVKHKYREYVFLTENEYENLLKNYGKDQLDRMIEKLDNYIGQNPKKNNKYTDHNRVLQGWVADTLKVVKINGDKKNDGISIDPFKQRLAEKNK